MLNAILLGGNLMKAVAAFRCCLFPLGATKYHIDNTIDGLLLLILRSFRGSLEIHR